MLLIGLIYNGGALEAARAEQSPIAEVAVKAGLVTVRAEKAPLADVLASLAREAHLHIVLLGDIGDLVTDSFTDLPVDKAVKRLSRWNSTVLVYDAVPGLVDDVVLTGVWVTNSASRSATSFVPTTGGQSVHVSTQLSPQLWMALTYGSSINRRRFIERLVREQGEAAVVTTLRDLAMGSPDPRIRRGALRGLVFVRGARASAAIEAALSDADAQIRNVALQALAEHRSAHEDAVK